jgi:hypothetical protein
LISFKIDISYVTALSVTTLPATTRGPGVDAGDARAAETAVTRAMVIVEKSIFGGTKKSWVENIVSSSCS